MALVGSAGFLLWLLLAVKKRKEKKDRIKKLLPALLMSRVFVPEIVCVFMDTDFMRLLRKSWDRPGPNPRGHSSL